MAYESLGRRRRSLRWSARLFLALPEPPDRLSPDGRVAVPARAPHLRLSGRPIGVVGRYRPSEADHSAAEGLGRGASGIEGRGASLAALMTPALAMSWIGMSRSVSTMWPPEHFELSSCTDSSPPVDKWTIVRMTYFVRAAKAASVAAAATLVAWWLIRGLYTLIDHATEADSARNPSGEPITTWPPTRQASSVSPWPYGPAPDWPESAATIRRSSSAPTCGPR